MANDDIQGTITDADGNVVQGATVSLFKHTGEVVEHTTTDASGNYIFGSHSEGDGTSTDWHVVARYDDGNGNYNAFSKPYVTASLSTAVPDSGGTHQWNYTEGSGTTVADSIASLDIAYSGATWQTGAGADDSYLELDGTDDYGDLGSASQSELSHFVRDAQGTAFVWVKPSSGAADSDMGILSSEFSTAAPAISIRHVPDQAVFVRIGSDDGAVLDINGGGLSASDEGDWVAYAASVDGTDGYLYSARPPDYDLVQQASGTVQRTQSADLNQTVKWGADTDSSGNPQRFWTGGFDVSFIDDAGWTQSELQSFVDNSKDLYA